MPEAERLDLIVCGPRGNNARCRLLATGAPVVLRSGDVWELVPGEVATVRIAKRWRFGGTDYVSGDVVRSRLDVAALRLTPLALRDREIWDPDEGDPSMDDAWGDDWDDDHGDWDDEEWDEGELDARDTGSRAHAREAPGDDGPPGSEAPVESSDAPEASGLRWQAEMQQILPGVDPDDFDTDSIVEASEWNEAGARDRARDILVDLLSADLRCLDAHAHLGNFAFDSWPEKALRHYRAGVAIGALSVTDPVLVLPWWLIDNRPFLRCLKGLGLVQWKLGAVDDARLTFERLLWLNPTDDQCARACLAQLDAGEPWRP